MSRLRGPAGWTIGTRFVVLFLLLLLVIQAAVFTAIRANIAANARAQVAHELATAEGALRTLLRQDAARLGDAARVLAADWAFRDAVKSGDETTVRSALENHGGRINASVSALLGEDFTVRAGTAADPGPLAATAARVQALWQRGGTGEAPSIVVLWNGMPTQFVLARLRMPLPNGWVLMGFALDGRLGRDLHGITGAELSLLVRDGAAAPWRTAATTLAASLDAEARAVAAADATPPTTRLGDDEFGWRDVSLARDGGDVRAVLLRSVDEAVRPYRRLQWLLAAITLGGVAAFAFFSLFAARRITQPVRRLVEAAQRLGRGDLATPLKGLKRGDEIGELAQAFEAMRHSVAQSRADLERLAYWDALTALPNRAWFLTAVGEAIAAGGGGAVLMLDLDRFKQVNDVLGYAFGDRLLQAAGQRLAGLQPPGAALWARVSGDEFALLLPGAGAQAALGEARRIAQALDAPFVLPDAADQSVDLSAGIGIACWPEHGTDGQTLLSRAEAAMLAAKRRKDGPMLYDPATDSHGALSLSLLSELRRAVDRSELRMFLQPKIGLADGRLLGAEALLRWQHPTRGLVPPMHFVPFAEQAGAIRQLTLWMFKEVVREWARLALDGPLQVSVNLSTRDLLDPELADKLQAALSQHAVPAHALCLEITESAMMEDAARSEATLRRLAERGFKLSIDDFGTGYSSLGYLKRLPVDELKIDKSFVMGMVHDADDAKIVRSTVDLAHNLGLTVVAEGVENADIWNALHRLGCDEAQGYHMSRPLPVEAFIAWRRRWDEHEATGWAGLEVA